MIPKMHQQQATSAPAGQGPPPQGPAQVNTINDIRLQMTPPGPLFTGLVGSGNISARQWISGLEANFQANNISSDGDKIAKAKASIDYEKGDAREIITSTTFTTFEELKRVILLFFDRSVDTPTLDFDTIKNMNWPSGQSFPSFMNKLMQACDNLERSGKFTRGTGFELGKGMVMSIVKKQFSPSVHQKVEDKALASLCPTSAALQAFMLEVFQIIGKHQRSDKIFNIDDTAEELNSLYLDNKNKVKWADSRTSNYQNKHRQGGEYTSRDSHKHSYNDTQRKSYKGRYSSTPPRYHNERSPSPGQHIRDRYRRNESPGGRSMERSTFRDRTRSRSYSPKRNLEECELECYNCGRLHLGGAKDCTKCLICGRNNHPTRECSLRKKFKQSEQVKFVDEDYDNEENSDSEYENKKFLRMRGE